MFLLGIVLTMGSMAFAQTTCSVTSVAVATAVATNPPGAAPNAGGGPVLGALLGPTANASNAEHTAPIAAGPTGNPGTPGGGTIRVTCTTVNANAPGVVALTISLGVPITNSQAHPAPGQGIRLVNATGDFSVPSVVAGTTTQTGTANVGIAAINNAAGTIVVGLGTTVGITGCAAGSNATAGTAVVAPCVPNTGIAFTANSTSTFDLAGVLVSTSGKSGAINATLVSSGGINVFTSSTCAAAAGACTQVITNVQAGLAEPTVPTGSLPAAVTALPNLGTTAIAGGAAVLNSSGGAVKSNFTIRVQ